jgi:hypothetical protein
MFFFIEQKIRNKKKDWLKRRGLLSNQKKRIKLLSVDRRVAGMGGSLSRMRYCFFEVLNRSKANGLIEAV